MNIFAIIIVTSLSMLTVVTAERDGNSTATKNTTTEIRPNQAQASSFRTTAVCTLKDFCCKLGRKAVRRSYLSLHTCEIEALIEGLEYYTSASHRLKPLSVTEKAVRMKAASSLHKTYGFRARLNLCQTGRSSRRECFQNCCERKAREVREQQAKATAKARVGAKSSARNNDG